MALKPFLISAPRWILVAIISSLLFLLGVTSEYARETMRDNERLRYDAQLRFQEQYSNDIRERLANVESATRRHAEDMTEFRVSMKEFSRAVSDHGNAVRELSYQVRRLSNRISVQGQ